MTLDAIAHGSDVSDVIVLSHVDLGQKGRTVNGLVIERDVDVVMAVDGGQVGDRTGAVAVVATVQRRLAGAFDGDAQSALTGASRVDDELGLARHRAAGQAAAPGAHPLGAARGPAAELVRHGADGRPAEGDVQRVVAQFGRREVDHVANAAGVGTDVRLDATARGTGDRHAHVRQGTLLRRHFELLQAVDGRNCWFFFGVFV